MKFWVLLAILGAVGVGACRTAAESAAAKGVEVSAPNSDDLAANLPAAGRSAFDFFTVEQTAQGPAQIVPYPLPKLMEALKTKTGIEQFRTALFPSGRSLQKLAAAPRFYEYPHAVLAAHGERAATPLFIGYVEPTNQLEVISYNETLGRYEFQIVTDYRAGGTPQVFYAERQVCMSCHQNGGPLFTESGWPETQESPTNNRLLEKAHGASYLGFTTNNFETGGHGPLAPEGVETATFHAQDHMVFSDYWQNACGTDNACRGALLKALLSSIFSYEFGAENHFFREFASLWDPIVAAYRQRPPHVYGLLRSRNPFTNEETTDARKGPPEGLTDDEIIGLLAKTAREPLPRMLDPLTPQSESGLPATLQAHNYTELEASELLGTNKGLHVLGHFLGGNIAVTDMRAIWRALRVESGDAGAGDPSRSFLSNRGRIVLNASGAARLLGRTNLVFGWPKVLFGDPADASHESAAPENQSGATILHRGPVRTNDGSDMDNPAVATGACHQTADNGLACTFDQNVIPADRRDPQIRDLSLNLAPDTDQVTQLSHLRLATEDTSVYQSRCNITSRTKPSGSTDEVVAFTCTTVDIERLFHAVDRLLVKTNTGQTDALAQSPFQRVRILSALFTELGVQRTAVGCCETPTAMPEARVEQLDLPLALIQDTRLRTIGASCFFCHSSGPQPPPFLRGKTEEEILAHVKTLAPRMLQRLANSTMPPATSAEARMLTPAARDALVNAIRDIQQTAKP